MKLRVLVFSKYFWPAYRAGGPIRSLSNLMDWVGDEFEFRVVTGDRDFGMVRPFGSVEFGSWTEQEDGEVYYVPREDQRLGTFRRLMESEAPDLIFINSLFEPSFGMLPLLVSRLLGRLGRTIVAPRGELAEDAMRKGWWKKRAYVALISKLGLTRAVMWKASNEREAEQIRRRVGDDVSCEVASNLPERMDLESEYRATVEKEPGELRLVYLSRVARKKNLEFAINRIANVSGQIQFDVYGPRDDPSYWSKCEFAAENLPDRVTFCYRGVVDHAEVIETLSKYHVFILPTRDENYGHVIMEALRAGCVVLISDRTPWTELEERGAGWILPLEDPAPWREALEDCVDMTEGEFSRRRIASVELARAEIRAAAFAAEQHRALFKKVALRSS